MALQEAGSRECDGRHREPTVLPERSGYYLGWRLVESYLGEHGVASTVRAACPEFQQADDRAMGIQTA